MSEIKKLAGQTLWYGASSIGAKMLNYLLTPILTYLMASTAGVAEYGDYSLLYAWMAVANIIFTYGFETGYFRFSNNEGIDRKSLFQTTFGSLLCSSAILVAIISLFSKNINDLLGFNDHPEYIVWALIIIGLDTASAIPFAKLRQENKPRKFAFIKIGGILINIVLVILLVALLPQYLSKESALGQWYYHQNKVGLIILANLIQSAFVFLILYKEWKGFRFKIDWSIWKKVFRFSSPMIVIGLAGMVNEVMDRQMLHMFYDAPEEEVKATIGIYSANYKLAIFITLFINAFKMAAEPFFFGKAKDKNAKETYANVMKWFVITLCIAFMFTAFFIDIWQIMIAQPYRVGLGVVPILLAANIMLGIYYNLSIWYKLTDRMRAGIWITILGAIITVVGNYIFIPQWGMYAAAWVTLACYTVMVIASYIAGQKYYPVNYPLQKIFTYLLALGALYFMYYSISYQVSTNIENDLSQLVANISLGVVLTCIFLGLVFRQEKEELKRFPLIGKYLK